MLKYQGNQVDQLGIWFVDGLAIAANPDVNGLFVERASRSPVNYDWFDIIIIVPDHEPARLRWADIIAPAFEDKYIPRMLADFWCGNTTNKSYWKTWWVETTTGDRYNHEFTCHHQSDVAKHFNLNYPAVQISSVVGKDRVYLNGIVRNMVDTDPFSANQPISSLLQFESVS